MNEWSTLFVPSYAGLELNLLDVDDSVPRDVVITVYPRTDGGHVDDQGSPPRETRWRVAFFPKSGNGQVTETHIDRFQTFLTFLHDGEAHTLVHPLTGSMLARPTDISFSASGIDRNYIEVNVTFLEASEEPSVYEIGTGSPIAAGVQDVIESNASLAPDLSAAGLSSTVGDEAAALAATWEENRDTITGRELNAELNEINNAIEDAMVDLEVATNVDRYPIMITLTKLAAKMQKLGDAVLAQSPEQITIVVREDSPLLAIAARYYGAREAVDRMDQLLELNRIRNPERIPAGTNLIGMAKGSPLTRREVTA